MIVFSFVFVYIAKSVDVEWRMVQFALAVEHYNCCAERGESQSFEKVKPLEEGPDIEMGIVAKDEIQYPEYVKEGEAHISREEALVSGEEERRKGRQEESAIEKAGEKENEKSGKELQDEEDEKSAYGKFDSAMAKVKILMASYQITSGFPGVLSISYPRVAMKLFKIFDFVNIFSFNVAALNCYATSNYDYLDTLIVTTILPIVIVFAIIVLFWIDATCIKYSCCKLPDNAIDVLKTRYVVIFLFFTYLIVTPVSTTICQAYGCTDVDPENVRPDPDINPKYFLT